MTAIGKTDAGEARHIYLAYSNVDMEAASKLRNQLIQAGEQVWWDQDILPGQNFEFTKKQAMKQAYAVLGCFSEKIPTRDAVHGELRKAIDSAREVSQDAIYMIPVLLGRTSVPGLDLGGGMDLTDIKPVDLSHDGDWQPAIESLLKALSAAPLRPRLQVEMDLGKPGMLHEVPRLPNFFLERQEELDRLEQLVLAPNHGTTYLGGRATVGVPGMGGVGKTVLATALARRPRVRLAFPDGIIWVTLGQTPDIPDLQAQIALCLSDEFPEFRGIKHGRISLTKMLRDKRCLLILDDVWEVAHAEAFPEPGPNGRLLITSRNREVMRRAGGAVLDLDLLPEDQALKLLQQASTTPVDEDLPAQAAEVARECGYLPLALAMVGAMVGHRPDRWSVYLERLRGAELKRIGFDFGEYGSQHENLYRAIHISVTDLPPVLVERYLEFAIIAEDFSIDEQTLELYWKDLDLNGLDAVECARLFEVRSLLERNEKNRLYLHDLLRDYVGIRVADASVLHNRLIDNYLEIFGWQPGERVVPGYFRHQFFYHLEKSGRATDMRKAAWGFLDSPGVGMSWTRAWKVLIDLGELGAESRQKVRQLLHEPTTNSFLIMRCLDFLGQNAKEDAKRLLQTNSDHQIICRCLKLLGQDAREDAKRLLQTNSDNGVICRCLDLLGQDAREDAKRLLQTNSDNGVICRCLALLDQDARKDAKRLLQTNSNHQVICRCLDLLGQDAREEAKRLLQTNSNHQVICRCLDLLGQDAREEAKRLLQTNSDNGVICCCLDLLGQDAREEAKRLLQTNSNHQVICRCLALLDQDAGEDAKRLLQTNTDKEVICSCLALLGDEAIVDVLRYLENWKNTEHQILSHCYRILGNRFISEKAAISILDSWQDGLDPQLRKLALRAPYGLQRRRRFALLELNQWRKRDTRVIAAALMVLSDKPKAMKGKCDEILKLWKLEVDNQDISCVPPIPSHAPIFRSLDSSLGPSPLRSTKPPGCQRNAGAGGGKTRLTR